MQHSRPLPLLHVDEALSARGHVRDGRFSAIGRFRSKVRVRWRGVCWHALAAVRGTRQFLESAVALVLLIAFCPVLLGAIGRYGRDSLQRSLRMGRDCRIFHQFFFCPRQPAASWLCGLLQHIPALWNIVRGEMSFVGPRPMAPREVNLARQYDRRRHIVRPGLICLWWVRERTNIAYGSEPATDVEYVESSSLRQDVALVLRALPAMLYGASRRANSAVLNICGIPVQNMMMDDAVAWIRSRAQHGPAAQVSFVNPHCANMACVDPEYHRILHGSELNLADGIGIKIAGRILGTELKQNVNGTDLFPRLLQSLSGTGLGVYLLGARPGVVEKVREWIGENHPAVLVTGCHHGYFPASDHDRIAGDIAASGAAVLVVAFGVPQQEKWISQHLQRTGVRVALGVGGLFDFYSGRIPRAPMWMRELGLEWVYRFAQEPRRMWKRYFVGNVVFLWRVIRQKYER